MEVENIETRMHEDSDDELQMFDEEDEPGNPEDEAEEVPAPGGETAEGEAKVIKPKRVIKNPQPKLDAVRLMGPRGIGIIQSTFKDIKFKGKGHEREDLRLLMKKLEHWAHRLFPKMPFDDALLQIEKLGAKKPVQNMMKRIRLDMFQSDEMEVVDNREEEEEERPPNDEVEQVDVFDELLSTGPFAEKRLDPISSQTTTMMYPPISQAIKPSVLTPEQRERMAKNRILALEKRKAKLLQEQKEKENKSVANTEPSFNEPNLSNETSNTLDSEIQTTSNEVNFNSIHTSPEKNTRLSELTSEENEAVQVSSLNSEDDGSKSPEKSPLKDPSPETNVIMPRDTEKVVNQTSNDVDMLTEDDLLNILDVKE